MLLKSCNVIFVIALCIISGVTCRQIPAQTETQESIAADCETLPPRPDQSGLRAGRYRVLLESPGAILCPLAADAGDCESIELDPEPAAAPGETLHGLVDDGLTVLVVLRVQPNSATVIAASFSIPDGRPIRSYKISASLPEPDLFAMLGPVLYVRECVGAGPGCNGHLYPVATKTGQPIPIGSETNAESMLNMYDASEIARPDGRWIFVDASGQEVIWMDLKNLRVLRRVRIADLVPNKAGAEPDPRPWSDDNFDPGAGNHAHLSGPGDRELRIVYRTNETEAPHWQVRLDANSGALLGAEKIRLCARLSAADSRTMDELR